MDNQVSGQGNNASSDLKSFNLYSGKAPVLLQIVAGLLWLGAAGLIISGLLSLVLNPIVGILFLVIAVLIIITAKSLFSMKKTAMRNTIIVCSLMILTFIYSAVTSGGAVKYSNLIFPAVLLAVAYAYRTRFVR